MTNKGVSKKGLPDTVAECHSLLRELFKRIEKLERDNKALQERLAINSSNSSLPPSQDRRKTKPVKRIPSERPSGGQAGHPGHFREKLDSSAVDKRVHSLLPSRCSCGGVMVQSDYVRHHVYELPVTPLEVTEYCLAKGYCNRCRRKQVAVLPEGVSWGITGPRLTSFITHLISKYHLSRRAVQAFLKEQYDFTLSLGTVFNKQRLVNTALEAPVAELRVAMEKSPWLNVDETGHRRDGNRQWLWGAMSSELAYFSVEPTRGKTVLRSFLGCFKQMIISDRYAAYNIFGPDRRQLCWAHLKRDFTRLAEKKERPLARLGKALLIQEAQLFSRWHRFKRGEVDREALLEQTAGIRTAVEKGLERGSYTDPSLKIARFCQHVWENRDALWTFLFVEGIEPTNNHAERCLRPAVLWRKSYFGTRSDYGSEFVARTASVLMTCSLQSKNAFEYLCQTTQHYFAKTTAPPLLECAVAS